MIPFRDENPSRRFPIITVLLIAANVLVFLYQQNLPQQGAFIYGAIPARLTGAGGPPGPALDPAWLTLFTAMFMHGSWLHLLGNMLYLWIFGDNVEDLLGSFRFLLFYLICGLAAAGLQIFMTVNPVAARLPMVGASGAIAGVLGAYLIKFPRARIRTLVFFFIFIQVVVLPASLVLGFWFILQLLNAGAGPQATGGVAFFAHIGGFVAGMVLVLLFTPARKRGRTLLEE
jgi:membrane associated rhomboid family serine protease